MVSVHAVWVERSRAARGRQCGPAWDGRHIGKPSPLPQNRWATSGRGGGSGPGCEDRRGSGSGPGREDRRGGGSRPGHGFPAAATRLSGGWPPHPHASTVASAGGPTLHGRGQWALEPGRLCGACRVPPTTGAVLRGPDHQESAEGPRPDSAATQHLLLQRCDAVNISHPAPSLPPTSGWELRRRVEHVAHAGFRGLPAPPSCARGALALLALALPLPACSHRSPGALYITFVPVQ